MSQERLLVLGAGPGGYTAAFYAADRGMKVTLVDAQDKPGGVCLHKGCIPSKALLHVAGLLGESRKAKDWGIDFGEPRIDLERLRRWKEGVVSKMSGGLAMLCKQRGVDFVCGQAAFLNSHSIKISGKDTLDFDRCILATGSRPVLPESLGRAGSLVMDSTAALELADIPPRLLVVGGGYIGLEMGTVYAALGSRVSVVEMTDALLPGVDRDLVRPLQAKLNNEFEAIHLNTKVVSVSRKEESASIVMEGPPGSMEETFDRVLVSVGRQPNSGDIGLENTGVELDENGFVKVGSRGWTNDPAILAIGDVTGEPMLAHQASHEARMAIEGLVEKETSSVNRVIPAVVFTDPEIAWCGLTESVAKQNAVKIDVARFPWAASGRAQTLDRTDGTTKLILEPGSGRILGVGIVGSGAGELIAEGVLAVELGAGAGDLAHAIHPHPTLSETLMEAADVFFGTATHIYKLPRK
ncbi:dihydrolipoamide dehydrogenase [Candidatus Nitromaritima sp. SCGC AAA799-A02]|nr:dihydrolipoamide dehydrogenase [Candidatus Nitromaritima sp. SCGC AAA799-C22]KMP11618.1 dihydrolipoamide dehydrogenase [Candidatus Nitromaritima sp. SCGC AAA799-A02]